MEFHVSSYVVIGRGSLEKRDKESPRFKTIGVYPILLLPLLFFFTLFAASVYIRHGIGVLVFGLFALTLSLGSIARIEVFNDTFVIKRILFGTSYWSFNEVKFKADGRVLAYGGMYGGWIAPFKWKECFEAIKIFKSEAMLPHKTPSRAIPYIYLLLPSVTLWLIGSLARYSGLVIPTLSWTFLWGAITGFPLRRTHTRPQSNSKSRTWEKVCHRYLSGQLVV